MERKPQKTNFWLAPLLGIVLFLAFGFGYYILIVYLLSASGLLQGAYFRFAGVELYVNYGLSAGLFFLCIFAIAALLSSVTTMVLLKWLPTLKRAVTDWRTTKKEP
jgi:amino acid transporter